MYKRNVLLILFLYIAFTIAPSAGGNLYENSLRPKIVRRRLALPPSLTSSTNEPTDSNGLGSSSVVLQLVGGLLSSMLETNGITMQTIGAAMNLFNANKIRQDLMLVRRGLNLGVRLASVLDRYLPAPSAETEGFDFLQKLKNKVRIYKPQGPTGEWVAIDKSNIPEVLANVPNRVQMIVDYVTQRNDISTTTTTEEPTASEANLTQGSSNSDESGEEEDDDDDDDDSGEVSSTTIFPPIKLDADMDVRIGGKNKNVPQGVTLPTRDTNATTAAPYSLPPLLATAQTSTTTETNPQSFNLLPTSESTSRPADNEMMPSFKKSTARYPNPSPQYGTPSEGKKGELPFQNGVLSGLPNMLQSELIDNGVEPEDGTKHKIRGGELDSNYGSVADIPLQEQTFFDNENGNLKDSFGLPVRNKRN